MGGPGPLRPPPLGYAYACQSIATDGFTLFHAKGLFIKDVRTHGGRGGNRFADICGQGGRGGFWNADVHISTFSATENRRLFYSVFGFPGQCEPRIKRTVM